MKLPLMFLQLPINVSSGKQPDISNVMTKSDQMFLAPCDQNAPNRQILPTVDDCEP